MNTPPPAITPPEECSEEWASVPAVRLVWHIVHLSNVLLSQFSAYLSLEALQRDVSSSQLTVPAGHERLLAAQAEMMVDELKNLRAATEAIVSSTAHAELSSNTAYTSLLATECGLEKVVGKSSLTSAKITTRG
ncbi:hypothetical protein BAUCODRAFT_24597 [Baudoinia panamericana UAMH 10762]|uniref:Uncharacterized protein n=1 Tax=Baudoinia panamericana (strain UAMH 10762) TaxID=717646 RepID=M2MVH1_BAUPA|nr:uncharacterized protein BAUCODRAFT_24597 [Baudoinia panamericana UAMH 10762]EMC95553.1 hypothetical protein BAUCODRAFT_24597 [Baudoinia panamericana UAMH 10762]